MYSEFRSDESAFIVACTRSGVGARASCIYIYMHTYAEHTCIHAHIRRCTCTQILANKCASNFARDRRNSLNAVSLSESQRFSQQLEGKSWVTVADEKRVAIPKYIMRVELARSERHAS